MLPDFNPEPFYKKDIVQVEAFLEADHCIKIRD